MEYLTVDFKIECSATLFQTARDLLADAVAGAGFEAFEETPSGLRGYVQKALLDREALDTAVTSLPLPCVSIDYTIADAPDRDWNETWEQEGFEPTNIDGKIIIEDFNHRPQDTMARGTTTILIDDRQAFGTGAHETTRMMIGAMLAMDLRGKRVLDCGCGTGILSLAASKLGAREVTAYDIDEWSVRNTRHNAELNGVGNITVMQGDSPGMEGIKGKFDIVLANINRNILLAGMPAMRRRMACGGRLVISGFYEQDLAILVEAAAKLGLSPCGSRTDNGWCCAMLTDVCLRRSDTLATP